jgi:orotidine-5'-phosphate decarboxylase
VAVALDTPDLETAISWAVATAPHVSALKVGLELFDRHGAAGVAAVRAAAASNEPAAEPALFLDVKLHDIPSTVAGAARALAALAPHYLTVHCLGGAAMIRAAVEALPSTRVTAVTVLTSMSDADLRAVGLAGPPLAAARRLAALAVAAGARAVVCSPQEVAAVRAEVGPDVSIITPGVRPPGAAAGDQARIATAEQALADGADLLVVGRPITGTDDPAAAAAALARLLRHLPENSTPSDL